MNIKYICIFFFILIIILFTVGYASQPICTTNSILDTNGNIPQIQLDGKPIIFQNPSNDNISLINTFYLTYTQYVFSNSNQTITIRDSSLSYRTTIEYISIATSIILFIGMLLGLSNSKFISKIAKIILFIAFGLMITIICLIQINLMQLKFFGDENYISFASKMESGYIMIISSTILMFLTYLIFVLKC